MTTPSGARAVIHRDIFIEAGGSLELDSAAALKVNGIAQIFQASRTYRGTAAPFSDATAGAITYTAAQILGGTIVHDPGGNVTDVFPTAVLLVAAVQAIWTAAIGDCIDCLICNGADGAEVITLAAGAGGAFDTNQVGTARQIPVNVSKLVRIRLTGVALGAEAYTVVA